MDRCKINDILRHFEKIARGRRQINSRLSHVTSYAYVIIFFTPMNGSIGPQEVTWMIMIGNANGIGNQRAGLGACNDSLWKMQRGWSTGKAELPIDSCV